MPTRSRSTHPPAELPTAEEFLTARRIAVTGVSHAPKGHGSNAVYCRLRDRGYDVVAINPNAPEIEGDPTYPDLSSVPGGVEAASTASPSSTAAAR